MTPMMNSFGQQVSSKINYNILEDENLQNTQAKTTSNTTTLFLNKKAENQEDKYNCGTMYGDISENDSETDLRATE